MQKEVKSWLKLDNKGNGHILVTVAGKTVPLRYTVHQQERFIDYLKSGNERVSVAEEAQTSVLQYLSDRDIDICEIALNPNPEQVDFSREYIINNLDLDQARLLAEFWQKEKARNIIEMTVDKEAMAAQGN